MKELKTEFFFISVFILFALIGHFLFNVFFLFLSLGLTIYLCWHLYQLKRFYSLIVSHARIKSTTIPSGLWGGVYRELIKRQNHWLDYRHRKRRIFSRFQQAFKKFPYTVIILDESWKIKWNNLASHKLFNKKTGIISFRLSELINHPVIDEYINNGDFKYPLEIESPIDKALMLSLQFIPLSGNALSTTATANAENETLLIIRNITSTYHLDQTRKDFVANVTHELKTPLTVMSGFLEPMCDNIDEIPAHWARSVELMYQQSIRMNDIVNELLLLSKLEMGDTIATEQLINMPELLKNSIHDAELLASKTAHHFSIKVQENLGLNGEIETIKTIINNLLVNAIKYTPQRSKITISWFAESDKAFLIVQDSGEGIAARHLSRLTERFYRIESGRSRDTGGTGLGLAIVNHGLLRHQGKLKINSEIGRGSTFTCSFPKERIETF